MDADGLESVIIFQKNNSVAYVLHMCLRKNVLNRLKAMNNAPMFAELFTALENAETVPENHADNR